jgi:hypothetical protein
MARNDTGALTHNGYMAPKRLLTFVFALALAVSVACGGGSPSEQTQASADATSAPSASASPIPDAVLSTFYPEYDKTKLNVHSAIGVPTDPKVPTMVYNLTDAELRPASIRAIYAAIEDIGNQDLSVDGRNDETINVQPRQNASRTMVLIPEGVPKPRSTVSDFIRTRDPVAATTFTKGHDTFSYVQMTSDKFTDGYFRSVPQFGTFNFAIEVCQATLRAQPVDANGAPLTDATLAQDAQEVVCNSIGAAVAARALNLPYDTYEAFASSHPIRITNGRTPALVVPQDAFMSFPTAGAIVR